MVDDRVLVTGGAGFIGSFLVDRLVSNGLAVTILDNLDNQVHPGGSPSYLNGDAEFIEGDVRNRDLLTSLLSRVDVVYHLASAVGVGQSQYQIDHYVDVNTHGTAVLLDVLVNENNSVRKVVVAASMSSYGEGLYINPSGNHVRPPLRPQSQMEKSEWEPRYQETGEVLEPIPTPETEHFNCNSIYAMTKAHQEEMVLNIGRTYSIPAVATRFFNVYGPRQSLSNPYTGVAAIFMSRIKNNQSPVVYEDGLQTRDFVSVHDVTRALGMFLETDAGDYQCFNVGSGHPYTIVEVAETIARVCGKDIQPDVQHKFRKGDVRHCYADITRIRDTMGWSPEVSFDEGISELVKWSDEVVAEDRFDQAAAELKEKGLI